MTLSLSLHLLLHPMHHLEKERILSMLAIAAGMGEIVMESAFAACTKHHLQKSKAPSLNWELDSFEIDKETGNYVYEMENGELYEF